MWKLGDSTVHYNFILEKRGRAVSFLGIHKSEPDIYIIFICSSNLNLNITFLFLRLVILLFELYVQQISEINALAYLCGEHIYQRFFTLLC